MKPGYKHKHDGSNYAERLVHLLLRSSEPRSWRIHGNGFLQIPLEQKTSDMPVRHIHVTHPAYFNMLPDNNARVHDHIWNMQVKVLAGERKHVQYRTVSVPNDYPSQKMTAHRVMPGCEFKEIAGGLNLIEIGSFMLKPGSTYEFPAFEYHMTPEDTLGITFMTRLSPTEDSDASAKAHPRVLAPVGELPTNAFGFVQPLQAALVAMLRAALEDFKQEELKYAWQEISQAVDGITKRTHDEDDDDD